MLERYGIFCKPDGTLDRVDTHQAFDLVRRDLANLFGFSSSRGMLMLTEPVEKDKTLRKCLEQQGITQDNIEEFIRKQSEAKEIGGCAVYTAECDLGIEPRPDYIVFMSILTGTNVFAPFLAEEIIHGEHVATIIHEQGFSYGEYLRRFHTLTEEFLGYLGRQVFTAILTGGSTGRYGKNLDLSKDFSSDDWSHFLAYGALDGLMAGQKYIPQEDLFHAPDEREVWQLMLEAAGSSFQLNINFPPSLKFDRLEAGLNRIISEAQAQDFYKINFAYQQS